MDKHLNFINEKRAEKTIQNLEKNNIKGYFVQEEAEALDRIREILNKGDVVSVGGSMTLFEIGAIELLRNGDYEFLDRYAEGLEKNGPEIKEIYQKTFMADAYLTSTNAITEEGELYNIDGFGNRVAAMIYGPRKVIVVAGINKIVRNLEEAIHRCESIASPANNVRLNLTNPCVKTGHCSDCTSPGRICNAYTVIKRQMKPDRMHVIIVNKELGY
jgi:L-lactate utilization protein LutB